MTVTTAAPAEQKTAVRYSRNFRRLPASDAADLIHRHRQGILGALGLFDVRDRATFERAHINGAEHLTEADVPSALQSLSKATPVLIYCYHGHASQIYAQMFADFRFGEVYSVDGGFDALAGALSGRDDKPATPLHGDLSLSAELLLFLTAYGFDLDDLNAPRVHGLTPLMRAALLGRVELIDELLRLDVAVDLRNADGNNALWLGCVSNDPAVVRRLVDAGINLDNRNDLGATCLMYAASSGKPAMVELLLQAGADPLVRNFDDAKAVDLAATRECLALLRHTVG